VRGQAG